MSHGSDWGPKDWFPGGGSQKDNKAVLEVLADTKHMLRAPGFVYTGDLDLGGTWALTFGHSRDSGLLEESNWETITKDLEERYPNDVEVVGFGHFAVGWIEEFAVRMLDSKGRVTRAARAALEWHDKLENYPVADEEDHSRREYEATILNIMNEGSVTESEAEKVFGWLWDNNQRAVDPSDDGGGYPKREDIDEALVDLGLRKPEEEEEEEPPPEPPYDNPNQAKFWPKV